MPGGGRRPRDMAAPGSGTTGLGSPDGTLTDRGLGEVPFGTGPHACPGRAHTFAPTAGPIEPRTTR